MSASGFFGTATLSLFSLVNSRSGRRRFLLLGRRFHGLVFTHVQAKRSPHVVFDSTDQFRMILQSLLGILTTLSEPIAFVRKPRAGLVDHPIRSSQIQQIAFA